MFVFGADTDKAAVVFSKYLYKLGIRIRRLQVVTTAEKQARCLLCAGNKKRLRLQWFELLMSRS